MVKQETKKPNIIKWILATSIVIAIIIGGAFAGGTFYPNTWTLEKLEDQFHKKELSEVHLQV